MGALKMDELFHDVFRQSNYLSLDNGQWKPNTGNLGESEERSSENQNFS